MPDDERKQPPPQKPIEREPSREGSGEYITNVARDSEILKASGARPSPTNPDTDPKGGPINKMADAASGAPATEIIEFSAPEPEAPKPAPSPTTDSGEGEA
jgi:hypothetical protein